MQKYDEISSMNNTLGEYTSIYFSLKFSLDNLTIKFQNQQHVQIFLERVLLHLLTLHIFFENFIKVF